MNLRVQVIKQEYTHTNTQSVAAGLGLLMTISNEYHSHTYEHTYKMYIENDFISLFVSPSIVYPSLQRWPNLSSSLPQFLSIIYASPFHLSLTGCIHDGHKSIKE